MPDGQGMVDGISKLRCWVDSRPQGSRASWEVLGAPGWAATEPSWSLSAHLSSLMADRGGRSLVCPLPPGFGVRDLTRASLSTRALPSVLAV